ncbi:MAG: sugar-transfer associated ATP-grasp domain-containing protein [Acidiphilium sp.]
MSEASRLVNPPPHSGVAMVASPADIALFRKHIKFVRKLHSGRRRYYTKRLTTLPRAARHAIMGVRDHGAAVQARDGVSMPVQFIRLFQAIYADLSIDDFYLQRLFLESTAGKRGRTFPLWHVMEMQGHLFEDRQSPDYPRIRNKDEFTRLCVEHAMPVVPILAEFIDGEMLAPAPIQPGFDLFSKPADLMLGVGGALWRWNTSGNYTDGSGAAFTLEDVLSALSRNSAVAANGSRSGRILLQKRVVNHPAMLGRLTSGGLATVRIVTCRSPSGSIESLPPVIRMPVGDAIADNIAQGGLAAPIDASGRISGPAIRKDKRHGVVIHARHPTTGVEFSGFQLPCWRDACELAHKAHRMFPALHFIGWDIAITADGPVLVEGNAWWDADLTLVPHAITLADTPFIPYYNFHFDNFASSAECRKEIEYG